MSLLRKLSSRPRNPLLSLTILAILLTIIITIDATIIIYLQKMGISKSDLEELINHLEELINHLRELTINRPLLQIVVHIIFVVPVSVVIFNPIFLLKNRFGTHIYIIWYTFSLSFVLFCSILTYGQVVHGLSLEFPDTDFESFLGKTGAKLFLITIRSLTDFYGKITIISTIIIVTIVPQILAYFLSGISGSATVPLFISQFTRLSIWNMIKFLAVCSGILLAFPVSDFISGKYDVDHRLIFASLFEIFISFGIMLLYFRASEFLNYLYRINTFRIFLRIHKYFTRHKSNSVDTENGNGGSPKT